MYVRSSFNPIDQLDKYLRWIDTGYMSCTGKMIGLGKTCWRSLVRYRRTGQAYTDIKHEKFSGNGSLMRLAPICIYYADNLDKAVQICSIEFQNNTCLAYSRRLLSVFCLYCRAYSEWIRKRYDFFR